MGAALDASMVFFLPLAVDMAVVYQAAGDSELFWVFPLLATLGSCAGASVTYRLGRKLGDEGIKRAVSEHRFEAVQGAVHERGAVALGLAALVPPPFPSPPSSSPRGPSRSTSPASSACWLPCGCSGSASNPCSRPATVTRSWRSWNPMVSVS